MGVASNFTCPVCAYEALVSGGDDAGMLGATTTISCARCRKLYDVMVWRTEEPDEWMEPRCPQNPAHPVARWTAPGPCPKCGGEMRPGDVVALWD